MVVLAIGLLKLLSEVVSGVNFIDDLNDALRTLKPVTDFFVRQPEWAFYPLWIATLVVGLIVAVARWRPLVLAMTTRRTSDLGPEEKLEDKVRASVRSMWAPDMTMAEAADYVRSRDPYKSGYRRGETGVIHDIHIALYSGKITAWAKLYPHSEEFQVDTLEWNHADLDREDGHALLRRVKMPICGIRFARGQIEAAWPPKR